MAPSLVIVTLIPISIQRIARSNNLPELNISIMLILMMDLLHMRDLIYDLEVESVLNYYESTNFIHLFLVHFPFFIGFKLGSLQLSNTLTLVYGSMSGDRVCVELDKYENFRKNPTI